MSVPAVLQTEKSEILHTERFGRHVHLITEDHSRVATKFKSVTHTTAATTTVTKPKPGGAIVVTDFIVSGEKINGGIITVQFNDGANQVPITKSHVTDGPVNLSSSLQGLCLGWKDAFIEVITSTTNQDATVSLWYYFVNDLTRVLSFADFNTERG